MKANRAPVRVHYWKRNKYLEQERYTTNGRYLESIFNYYDNVSSQYITFLAMFIFSVLLYNVENIVLLVLIFWDLVLRWRTILTNYCDTSVCTISINILRNCIVIFNLIEFCVNFPVGKPCLMCLYILVWNDHSFVKLKVLLNKRSKRHWIYSFRKVREGEIKKFVIQMIYLTILGKML